MARIPRDYVPGRDFRSLPGEALLNDLLDRSGQEEVTRTTILSSGTGGGPAGTLTGEEPIEVLGGGSGVGEVVTLRPTLVGQVLMALSPVLFSRVLPLTSPGEGWLTDTDGSLLVTRF